MKPLHVLVLVLVAVVALVLVISSLPEGGSLEVDLPPGGSAIVDPGRGPGPDDLSGPVGPDRRDEAEVATGSGDRDVLGEAFPNSLEGRVQNKAGEPVADASVLLTRTSGATIVFLNDPVDRSGDRRTTTAKDGTFSFQRIEPYDSYALEVSHPDYSRASVGPVSIRPEGKHVEPPIELTNGVTLRGYVYDGTRLGVSGATLHLDDLDLRVGARKEHDRTVQTNNKGYYEFLNVETGHKTLTVEADGYGKVFINDQPIPAGLEEPFVERNVTLEVAEMIAGHVYDQLQRPIADAAVLAIAYSSSNQQCRDEAVTDAQGEFWLRSLDPGMYTLQVQKSGYKPELSLRVQTGNTNVVVELTSQACISGRVMLRTSGEPVTSFRIVLRQTFENHPATSDTGTHLDVRNSPDGTYELCDVKPGSYVIEARADGYAPSFSDPFRVIQGQAVAGINVRVNAGGSITGVVLGADGQPRSRAQIETFFNDWTNSEFDRILGDQLPTNVSKRKVRTDAEGRFVLEHLNPETYQIRISAQGHSELIKTDVYVSEGKETALGTVRLLRGGTITGAVLDPAGVPVKGAQVRLRINPQAASPDRQPRYYLVRSDEKGRYTLSGVHPGSYILGATLPRGASAETDVLLDLGDERPSQKDVKVSDGQTLTIDLKL